ncbi:hypothetical protein GCM10010123_12040 [Pilimelia anulata]|uniref:Orc1-like AAA ATPase domain-containing protein n=1 Tax=Pilimelia anulata TaxID=53371 RepID=A0A8J3B7X4_9ACTN|nr:AAA family ATPase [Pilimelia anulata]GGJ83948.1 hypothetical protein GCM10010123_12040 [Pilimelia anulata]
MAVLLADRLAGARRRGFVGRTAELAALADLLAGAGTHRILYLRGPGGVGKTTLLRRYADLARDAHRPVCWLDGRDLDAAPVDALRAALPGRPADPLAALADAGTDAVWLVDAVERVGGGQRWLWDELLPRLPGGAAAVLAGRDPVPARLGADPGWRELLRPLAVGNLDAADAVALLRRRGVPAAAHPAALALSHGHPLALALYGDVCAAAGGPPPADATRQVVAALLRELVDAVPDGGHRAALEAVAQVRATTEPLLAALLDVPDARAEFARLRELSIIDAGPRGLEPHDLVREALASELRWRHPRRHAAIRQRARAWYRDRFAAAADPAAQRAVLADYAFLHRHAPGAAALLARLGAEPGADGPGGPAVAPAVPADLPALRALVAAHEGPESAALFAHWAGIQPDAVHVVRGGAGPPAGLYVLLALDRTTAAQRAPDPAAVAAWQHLAGSAPPRPGERVTLVRHWLAADGYQEPGPVPALISLEVVRHCLTVRGLAFHFLPCADPDAWAGACAHADLARLPGADFAVGGRRYGVYGHDWRATPPLAWLAVLADREDPDAGGPPAGAAPAGLDEPAFAAAVRAALRDLERPDRLADSPLAAAAAVRGGADPARAVAGLLRDGARQLADSARDRSGYRALHHTYLQPAGTQRAAAELLDLPMSTYRRHLAAGTARLVALLWRRETLARDGG